MDSPRLPPLNAIRVFVEAARLMSFSRAGAALHMTQGGVSRHIASLEQYLGIALFERQGPSVSLTNPGRQYYDTVKEAIATIEFATRQVLGARSGSERLLVRTSLPTFALTIVIPMLPQFRIKSPVKVDVVTTISEPGIGDEFDVLITRDLNIATTEHWELLRESLVCVAAPGICERYDGHPVAQWPFIVAKSRPDVLPVWANRLDLSPDQINVTAVFDHYFLAIAAAIGSMGHLVVPKLLVLDHLRQGVLQETSKPEITGDARYWAFMNPHSNQPQLANEFCRWLKGLLRSRSSAAGPGLAQAN